MSLECACIFSAGWPRSGLAVRQNNGIPGYIFFLSRRLPQPLHHILQMQAYVFVGPANEAIEFSLDKRT